MTISQGEIETNALAAHKDLCEEYIRSLQWVDAPDYVRTQVAGNIRAYDNHVRPFRFDAELAHRFDFHPATTAEKRSQHGSVREACKSLAHFIDASCPDGREKALSITKLEEAMMWANAAIAREAAK